MTSLTSKLLGDFLVSFAIDGEVTDRVEFGCYDVVSCATVARNFWHATRCNNPVSYTHLTLPTILRV